MCIRVASARNAKKLLRNPHDRIAAIISGLVPPAMILGYIIPGKLRDVMLRDPTDLTWLTVAIIPEKLRDMMLRDPTDLIWQTAVGLIKCMGLELIVLIDPCTRLR
jgi:hypothetical protein